VFTVHIVLVKCGLKPVAQVLVLRLLALLQSRFGYQPFGADSGTHSNTYCDSVKASVCFFRSVLTEMSS